jgi:hypothetical protein
VSRSEAMGWMRGVSMSAWVLAATAQIWSWISRGRKGKTVNSMIQGISNDLVSYEDEI